GRDFYDKATGELIYQDKGWGNPWVVGEHGTHDECCDKYEEWAPRQPGIMAHVHRLRGKRLGCFCKKKSNPKRCHGETLARLADEAPGREDPKVIEVQAYPLWALGY